LGIDQRFWGAEFFCPCGYKNFKRTAHLREIPLLGSERAILEPWRLTAVWLYLIYGERFWRLGLGGFKKANRRKWEVLKKMYLSGFNSPMASSMGRLFDAVGSLVFEKNKVDFEAELAIRLEKLATRYSLLATSYSFKIVRRKDGYIIDPTPMFRQIILELKRKELKEKIAYKFHLTIAKMIKDTCLILRKQTSINKAVLSGGVFQNNLLLRLSLDLLYKEGFDVFNHNYLPCNDSGISLGQAAIANFKD
ncbi:MAG: carbamoyltransferase HypF, partial [Candidatus Omnitrophica bacterium]|nr:carbamoyltransferase HypF [Candidatus Omnitrophota bacterium]